MTDNTLKARLERCKALQEPEQVVAVKEGYSIAAFSNGTAPCGVDFSDEVPLSEALTLRTAEDVRREAFKQATRVADKQMKKKEQSIRREALEEAAYIATNACLVPPDGGSPTAEEAAVCEEAANRIRALIDNPAPKQDTRALQAAAWDEGYIASADDGWIGAQTTNPYRKGECDD